MPAAQHSRLGASKAARWMGCPGSVEFAAQFPDPTTQYAVEGTAAHMLAEMSLKNEVNPQQYIGADLSVWVGTDDTGNDIFEVVKVTEEMAAHVQEFTDYCFSLVEQGADISVEQRVSLERLSPPEPMFGTVDFRAYFPEDHSLEIVDLKYGSGVLVMPQRNPQLMYYAIGSAIPIIVKENRPLTEIRTTIVQPRIEHDEGPVRTASYTWEELAQFSKELLAAAQETQREDAPLVPGSWCKFCPAKGACPALAEMTTDIVQSEFSALPAQGLPATDGLTVEQVATILEKAPLIEDFLTAVRQHATRTLELGGEIPGYKLVEGRRSRGWTDEAQAEGYLRRKLGANVAFQKSLISPAKAEKAFKAAGMKRPPHMDKMIQVVPGRLRLAHESDSKPAVTPGDATAQLFDAVEDTHTETE